MKSSIIYPISLSLIVLTIPAFSQTQKSSTPLTKPAPIKIEKSSPFPGRKTIVEEVQFSGLDTDLEDYGVYVENAIYETDFKKLLGERKSAIVEGDKFNEERVGRVIELIKEWLARRDYLKATVTAYGTKLSTNAMRLTFSVERGLPLDPPELDFVGAETISNQELIADFKSCSRNGWTSYEAQKFNYYSQNCSRSLLFSKGFWRGKIPYTDKKLLDNHYLITFRVYEGPRYRWGDIKIEGAKEFSNKQILEMLGQNTGDVADARDLKDFVFERLKRAYSERGYLQYNADFDPEIIEPKSENADGTVNVRLTIDEGKRLTIRRISFAGVDTDEQESLVQGFPLKAGDVWIESKVREGIEAINKSGRYRPIDNARDVENNPDVEIKADEAAGELNLTIKLKKTP